MALKKGDGNLMGRNPGSILSTQAMQQVIQDRRDRMGSYGPPGAPGYHSYEELKRKALSGSTSNGLLHQTNRRSLSKFKFMVMVMVMFTLIAFACGFLVFILDDRYPDKAEAPVVEAPVETIITPVTPSIDLGNKIGG